MYSYWCPSAMWNCIYTMYNYKCTITDVQFTVTDLEVSKPMQQTLKTPLQAKDTAIAQCPALTCI